MQVQPYKQGSFSFLLTIISLTRTSFYFLFRLLITPLLVVTIISMLDYAATPTVASNSVYAVTNNSINNTDCQFFPQTQFSVCGRFLDYWYRHGGLAQQGYPISSEISEQNAPPPAGDGKTHQVQYFQRARFEYHPENAAPYDVLLGLLGSEEYQAKYSSGNMSPTPPLNGNQCQTFSQTNFSVCGSFLDYWKANGGLVQQGYPISNVILEQNAPPPAGDGKIHLVQYFQRARFEEHLENQPPYQVLLGLLGSEQFDTKKLASGSTTLPFSITVVSGNNQSTPVNGLFAQPLVIKVTNGRGQPVFGATVTFAGPPVLTKAIAGGIFVDTNTETATVTTAANGLATSPLFQAGSIEGPFMVTVTLKEVTSSSLPPTATFFLKNAPPLATEPNSPINVKAYGDDGKDLLSWSPDIISNSPPILGYNIYRATENDYPQKLNSSLIATTSYTDTNVVNGDDYTYWITAVNIIGESGYSSQVFAEPTPHNGQPARPTLTQVVGRDDGVVLVWFSPDANTTQITGYNVYRLNDNNSSNKIWTLVNAAPVTDTTYLDKGHTSGTYRVTALNVHGESLPSKSLSAVYIPQPKLADSPNNLIGTVQNSQVLLEWTAPSDLGSGQLLGYNVYRWDPGYPVKINSTLVLGTSYSDAKVEHGQIYQYTVRAVTTAGEGAPSEQIIVRP